MSNVVGKTVVSRKQRVIKTTTGKPKGLSTRRWHFYDEITTAIKGKLRGPKKRTSKHTRHQGARECARRVRQMGGVS